MKRSEMIDKLTKLLFKQALENQPIRGLEKDDFKHFETIFKRDAKQILKLIEKEGMKPPFFYRPHDWNKRGITYEKWLSEPSKINEWEPENE